MFNAEWLKECTDVLDPSQVIEDCYLDYCMDKTRVHTVISLFVIESVRVLYSFRN